MNVFAQQKQSNPQKQRAELNLLLSEFGLLGRGISERVIAKLK